MGVPPGLIFIGLFLGGFPYKLLLVGSCRWKRGVPCGGRSIERPATDSRRLARSDGSSTKLRVSPAPTTWGCSFASDSWGRGVSKWSCPGLLAGFPLPYVVVSMAVAVAREKGRCNDAWVRPSTEVRRKVSRVRGESSGNECDVQRSSASLPRRRSQGYLPWSFSSR